jgi:hypothetical protein
MTPVAANGDCSIASLFQYLQTLGSRSFQQFRKEFVDYVKANPTRTECGAIISIAKEEISHSNPVGRLYMFLKAGAYVDCTCLRWSTFELIHNVYNENRDAIKNIIDMHHDPNDPDLRDLAVPSLESLMTSTLTGGQTLFNDSDRVFLTLLLDKKVVDIYQGFDFNKLSSDDISRTFQYWLGQNRSDDEGDRHDFSYLTENFYYVFVRIYPVNIAVFTEHGGVREFRNPHGTNDWCHVHLACGHFNALHL